jgi:hypothetical protein
MYAAEPVQRLRLLRHRLAQRSERWFHEELAAIFATLQDLHTVYGLPTPFHSHVAYLPFRVEEYYVDGERRYVASQVSEELGEVSQGRHRDASQRGADRARGAGQRRTPAREQPGRAPRAASRRSP